MKLIIYKKHENNEKYKFQTLIMERCYKTYAILISEISSDLMLWVIIITGVLQ